MHSFLEMVSMCRRLFSDRQQSIPWLVKHMAPTLLYQFMTRGFPNKRLLIFFYFMTIHYRHREKYCIFVTSYQTL